ncbi:response regulator [Phenylobacterium sp.]|uniref:response regulator n=1 Tax=Phenylobacterium sp. TaxID=1871053 RepID=UPI0025F70001|nr:response regulator [Phenylobacterium sp.]MBX3485845.1 response regulator [Phenylobacterium sp.]MCW5758963.1 response regulator [Phenylobacterium sp.]
MSPPPRPTVYVVDDDDAVRRALAFALDLDGFAVETFESGEALLLRAPSATPGCLVIDQRLPGISGLDTLRQLRARQVTLPAVFVTSHPKPAFREAAAQAAAPILEKPLEGATLISAIQQLLDRPGSREDHDLVGRP